MSFSTKGCVALLVRAPDVELIVDPSSMHLPVFLRGLHRRPGGALWRHWNECRGQEEKESENMSHVCCPRLHICLFGDHWAQGLGGQACGRVRTREYARVRGRGRPNKCLLLKSISRSPAAANEGSASATGDPATTVHA